MSLAQEEEYLSNTPQQYAIHELWRKKLLILDVRND